MFIADMGINLCCAEVDMPQDLLEDPDIDPTVLIHQCSGGMPQLVRGVAPSVQAGGFQMKFNDLLHAAGRDRRTGAGGEK